MTVRRVSGLRRDSEIMFVRRDENGDERSDGSLGPAAAAAMGAGGRRPTLLGIPEGAAGRRESFGIFDRAGFGTVTFRRDSMAATLFAVQNDDRCIPYVP